MTQHKFAACSGEDVFGIFTIEDDPEINPTGQKIIEGYLSGALIVEIPENIPAQIGWLYDGETFSEPTE